MLQHRLHPEDQPCGDTNLTWQAEQIYFLQSEFFLCPLKDEILLMGVTKFQRLLVSHQCLV